MTGPAKVLVLALTLALAGCAGESGDVTGPNGEPPTNDPGVPPVNDPGTPPQNNGVQGSYVLEQINGSHPGQLVTISNPDGKVIGLYRFEVTTLTMDALQAFALELRYTDDKEPLGIDDAGEFKGAGPVTAEGAIPLTFYSAPYEDQFTGVVLGDIVAIKYDFDGNGEPDTSFGFRRE